MVASQQPSQAPVVIVGAGMAGLCAALRCSALGLPVVILEAAASPGGKLAPVRIGAREIDAGPTVLTMRWVFEEIFAACGLAFSDYVGTIPMPLLARHFWPDGACLDLYQSLDASADAIGRFAGAADARGYRAFAAYAQRLYETTRAPFIHGEKPSLGNIWKGRRWGDMTALLRIDARVSMHTRLRDYFRDPRLLQLFGRYATYCGGSPYQTPATLNLVAHVERLGVWRVQDGMGALADGLADAARDLGAQLFCDSPVVQVTTRGGRATGVRLRDGTHIAARAVVVNAGPRAVAALTRDAKAPARDASDPALSAVTCAFVARPEGAPLAHHNVFFCDDARAEFSDIFKAGRVPRSPTVYLCAADRHGTGTMASVADERILTLVNAPAGGKEVKLCPEEILSCLAVRGLRLEARAHPPRLSAPEDFARRYAHTGGALYGDAPHSWRAFFRRAGSRSDVSGLYLCGGSVHPGPGLPMTALSGQQAARALAEDFGLTNASRPAATLGGTSTRKATTAAKRCAP